jgi:hypothetical protein
MGGEGDGDGLIDGADTLLDEEWERRRFVWWSFISREEEGSRY